MHPIERGLQFSTRIRHICKDIVIIQMGYVSVLWGMKQLTRKQSPTWSSQCPQIPWHQKLTQVVTQLDRLIQQNLSGFWIGFHSSDDIRAIPPSDTICRQISWSKMVQTIFFARRHKTITWTNIDAGYYWHPSQRNFTENAQGMPDKER